MLPLQIGETSKPVITHLFRVLLETFVANHVEHLESNRAGNRIASERAEKFHSVRESLSDFRSRHDCRKRERISNRFAEDNDVRHDSLRLKSPEMRTQSAEPHLHFVGNANSAGRANAAIDFGEIVRRENDLSRDAR